LINFLNPKKNNLFFPGFDFKYVNTDALFLNSKSYFDKKTHECVYFEKYLFYELPLMELETIASVPYYIPLSFETPSQLLKKGYTNLEYISYKNNQLPALLSTKSVKAQLSHYLYSMVLENNKITKPEILPIFVKYNNEFNVGIFSNGLYIGAEIGKNVNLLYPQNFIKLKKYLLELSEKLQSHYIYITSSYPFLNEEFHILNVWEVSCERIDELFKKYSKIIKKQKGLKEELDFVIL
jgi:hypothetical protein